jgi:hypothetical protein
MRLAGTDRLRFDDGDIPSLVCDKRDGIQRIPAVEGKGLHPVPCAADSARLAINGQYIDPDLSGGGSALLPWVIAPRASAVSTSTPAIRWHALLGVKEYDITLRGNGVEWSKHVEARGDEQEISLPYPPGEAPLKSGVHYKVIVSANGLRSDEADGKGLGFQLIDADALKKVESDVAAIRGLRLDPVNTAILIASRYAAARLLSDAALVLESADTQQNGEVLRLLAAVYSSAGAGDQVRLVLHRAATANDSAAGHAETFERLAQLALQDGIDAAGWLKKAADAWAAMGDAEKAEILRSRIAKEQQ